MSAVLASMDAKFRERLWKKFIVFIPYLWLLLFFLTPFLIVLKISFADPLVAQPPFTPLFQKSVETGLSIYTTFDNYLYLYQDS